jgi:hypothetical protein
MDGLCLIVTALIVVVFLGYELLQFMGVIK